MNRNKKGSAAPKAASSNSKSSKQGQGPSHRGPQMSVAAAYATGMSSGKARVIQVSADSTRIRHAELVGSVTGSVAFANSLTFSVNPGLAATFPWLSTQALGWEKYRFNMLKLCYYTRTGSNVPGSVMLIPDYDAADLAPQSEQVASAYYGTQEDAPWKNICLTFDARRLAGERFIRQTVLAPNLDVKTYDCANAYVNTVDGTAVAWGKVWFEYDVTLFNPQLPSTGAPQVGTLANGGTPTQAAPFGTTSAPINLGSIAASVAAATPLAVNLSNLVPGAEYLISTATQSSTSNLNNPPAPTLTSGLTLVNQLGGFVNGGTTLATSTLTALATAASAVLTYGAALGGVTGTDLTVTKLPLTNSF